MNKNNYKNALNQIHAKDELKEKTFEKIVNKRKTNMIYILNIAAMLVIIFSASIVYLNNSNKNKNEIANGNTIANENKVIAKVENDLPRFKNIQELKEVLEKNSLRQTNGEMLFDATATTAESAIEESVTEDLQSKSDYSTTNTQVENVDEADVVKTDGNYIYYVSNNTIYIVDAEKLETISTIQIQTENERFSPSEIFIKDDKLVVLGNGFEYENQLESTDSSEISRIRTSTIAKAIVYNISNKENPEEIRQVGLDGYYMNSRMIGDNLYFISNKSAYYNTGMRDEEILPIVMDLENTKRIDCTDIVYFEGSESYQFMMVAGFNIQNNEEANIETFFGAGDTVYASENNLYITRVIYDDDYENCNSEIYKFSLIDSQVVLKCKGEVKGNLNNQFSMDEYDGNLRIATTVGYDEDSSNQLYILDDDLKEIGKIENLAKGEKIYSVRFIGKIGYVVTFKQIDPLFVLDLSDPTNQIVKGELKIPGYSSYLHPYDETHIIGIGHNTKSNGYGGVTNANMKMSMFDVSDLENPKEVFNIDIGGDYADSSISYNHKALFYNKDKNLVGFPITYREYNARDDKNGFVIFKIDLEKGFEIYGEILQKIDYRTNIDRAIYIGNTLYTLGRTQIVSYNLETLEKIKTLELEDEEDNMTMLESVMIKSIE